MAASYAEVQTQIKNAIAIFDKIYNANAVDGTNVLGLIDAFEQSLEGDRIAQAASAVRSLRGMQAGSISRGTVRSILDPLLLELGKAQDFAEGTPQAILAREYRYFIENSKSVNSRAFSFGSPTADGGNTGTGLMRRISLDQDNQPIEIGNAEAFEAYCDRDQGQTNRHEESFIVRGADASIDDLQRLGSGQVAGMKSVSARDSLLLNPSFSSGTSATSVTNWTATTGSIATHTEKVTATYYRDSVGDTTPASLKMHTGNVTLQQKISTTGRKLSENVPYYLQIAWNRQTGSGAGTLAIALGAANTSVVAAAQTGWQVLFLPLTAANCWWKGFKENDLDITVGWTHTSGYILVDDFLLVPFDQFRGQYYKIIGGATPFMLRDKFTWSDTVTDAKIQYWFQFAYGFWFPSDNAAGETWTDP